MLETDCMQLTCHMGSSIAAVTEWEVGKATGCTVG
jgi:hypothetical protein